MNGNVALVVPVFRNFEGFAELIHSVDYPVVPVIIPNWVNNIGVSAAWNQGMQRAIDNGNEYALVCNDDIVLASRTIEKLIDGINVGFDMVTAFNTRDAPAEDRPHYDEAPDFSCFMIRPKVFTEKFGWFDEKFTPAYFEDNDMHYRMKISGGMAVCRTDAAMFHKGSVTQNWGGKPFVDSYMFENNRAYYGNKWGGWPGYETFTTPFNGEK